MSVSERVVEERDGGKEGGDREDMGWREHERRKEKIQMGSREKKHSVIIDVTKLFYFLPSCVKDTFVS